VLLGFLLTTGVELGQLIVYTRFTNTTDIIVGTTGVWAGAWLMRRWRGAANSASISLAATRQAALPWRWAAIAAVYTLLLVAVSWAPFNFVRDRQLVETHLDNFFSVPFKVLYQGTEMNALRMVLRKTLWFAPLGCLLAMQVVIMSRIRLPRALLIWCSLFAALVVAGVVEMGKIFLPERNPDLTSMLISASGSAVGLFIMLRLVLSPDTQRGTVVPSLARETLSPRITEVR